MKSEFVSRIYGEVAKIPLGRVLSYSGVAARAGYPGASRAVGNALSKNKDTASVPCHRVVRKDGTPGGYSGGAEKKIKLLKSEGVKIKKVKGKWKLV